jgi:hypothetical protein
MKNYTKFEKKTITNNKIRYLTKQIYKIFFLFEFYLKNLII